jgi:hypothetical protein
MAKKVKTSFYFSMLLKFQALVCFGHYRDTRKSCEIFDGSSTAPTFDAKQTHKYGGLGFFIINRRLLDAGTRSTRKRKRFLKSAGPRCPIFLCEFLIIFEDFYFFRRISTHSLVGLDNGAMLLLGGYDWGSYSVQTGIWEIQEEEWSRIGDFSKV